MTDEENREIYHAEYRAMLKSVLAETLADNDASVRAIFKEAVKEWLTEQTHDWSGWVVRVLAGAFVVLILVLVFNPKR